MLTIENIFEYAKAKNLKVDYFSECFEGRAFLNEFNEVYYPQTHIGLQVNSYTYFWWKFDAKDENPYLFFNQRYNAGSGHVIKAWNTGFNMGFKIQKFLDNNKLELLD